MPHNITALEESKSASSSSNADVWRALRSSRTIVSVDPDGSVFMTSRLSHFISVIRRADSKPSLFCGCPELDDKDQNTRDGRRLGGGALGGAILGSPAGIEANGKCEGLGRFLYNRYHAKPSGEFYPYPENVLNLEASDEEDKENGSILEEEPDVVWVVDESTHSVRVVYAGYLWLVSGGVSDDVAKDGPAEIAIFVRPLSIVRVGQNMVISELGAASIRLLSLDTFKVSTLLLQMGDRTCVGDFEFPMLPPSLTNVYHVPDWIYAWIRSSGKLYGISLRDGSVQLAHEDACPFATIFGKTYFWQPVGENEYMIGKAIDSRVMDNYDAGQDPSFFDVSLEIDWNTSCLSRLQPLFYGAQVIVSPESVDEYLSSIKPGTNPSPWFEILAKLSSSPMFEFDAPLPSSFVPSILRSSTFEPNMYCTPLGSSKTYNLYESVFDMHLNGSGGRDAMHKLDDLLSTISIPDETLDLIMRHIYFCDIYWSDKLVEMARVYWVCCRIGLHNFKGLREAIPSSSPRMGILAELQLQENTFLDPTSRNLFFNYEGPTFKSVVASNPIELVSSSTTLCALKFGPKTHERYMVADGPMMWARWEWFQEQMPPLPLFNLCEPNSRVISLPADTMTGKALGAILSAIFLRKLTLLSASTAIAILKSAKILKLVDSKFEPQPVFERLINICKSRLFPAINDGNRLVILNRYWEVGMKGKAMKIIDGILADGNDLDMVTAMNVLEKPIIELIYDRLHQ